MSPSFTFTKTPAKFKLGQSKKLQRISDNLGSNAFTCSFSTGGSSKILTPKRVRARVDSPFASMNMAFASVTISKPATALPTKKKKSFAEVLEYAGKKALSGGVPGMVAMGLQVLTLMWLR
jgi:hypothetical protein